MALDLVDYEQKAREAVKAFWGNREAALHYRCRHRGGAQCGEYRRFRGAVLNDQPQDVRGSFGRPRCGRSGTIGLR